MLPGARSRSGSRRPEGAGPVDHHQRLPNAPPYAEGILPRRLPDHVESGEAAFEHLLDPAYLPVLHLLGSRRLNRPRDFSPRLNSVPDVHALGTERPERGRVGGVLTADQQGRGESGAENPYCAGGKRDGPSV